MKIFNDAKVLIQYAFSKWYMLFALENSLKSLKRQNFWFVNFLMQYTLS